MNEFLNAINSKYGRGIAISIVLLFGIFVVLIPMFKSSDHKVNIFVGLIVFVFCSANFLSNILYAIVVNKNKSIEYILIPGLTVVISEYLIFHDFSKWIASSSTAAIALIFTPIPLLGSFAVSCLIASFITKIRNKLSQ